MKGVTSQCETTVDTGDSRVVSLYKKNIPINIELIKLLLQLVFRQALSITIILSSLLTSPILCLNKDKDNHCLSLLVNQC